MKLEYFVDSDPGIGNASSINIPSNVDVTFPFTIDLSAYSIGYHNLYIRTKDNLGRWSLTARRNIEVLPAEAKRDVVSGEYFIDEDPGFGAALPINVPSPDTAILQNFTAATTGLSEGYHKLYGRFKDVNGNWSLTFRRNIEVIKGDNNKVVNGEYFFRTDNGFGDCTPVVFPIPAADGTFTFNILSSEIPANADTLFIRVRDDVESRWSITAWNDSLFYASLPLTMLSFNATRHMDMAELNWQTTNEINTAYFTVQRSTDALHFTNIGVVSAKNNGGMVNNYSYTDNIAGINSKVIYYRLQQVDIDAKSQYSKIAAILIDGIRGRLKLMPNPASHYINIIPEKAEDLSGAVITIVDMTGHVSLKQPLSASDIQQVDVSRLAKGMYIVNIIKRIGIETQKLLIE